MTRLPVKSPVLHKLRIELGISRQELADRLGKHRTTIMRWERGAYSPESWEDLCAWAAALGAKATDVLEPEP